MSLGNVHAESKRIFVCAADVSSEMHLVEALKHLLPKLKGQGIIPEIFGIAGEKTRDLLTSLGVPYQPIAHTKDFMVGGGPLDVVGKLPLRRKVERTLERMLYGHEKSNRPVWGAILVDNGEINLRLSGLLHFFRVPVVYYIPPKIWVWRKSRIEALIQHVSVVLGILPFEKPLYDEYQMPFIYVGNPLLDEINASANPVKIPEGRNAVTLMPGSRYGEIKFHTPLFIDVAKRFLALSTNPKDIVFLLPISPALDFEKVIRPFRDALGEQLFAFRGQSHECLKASRVALIKSGTSTLEAGVLGIPMVITYKSGWLSKLMFHHVLRYKKAVGLVNLFHDFEGPPVCPEYILEKAEPGAIAHALNEIFEDGEARDFQLHKLSSLKNLMKAGTDGKSPSEQVAKISEFVFQKRILPEDDAAQILKGMI